MARKKAPRRTNIAQESLERARREANGQLYVPPAPRLESAPARTGKAPIAEVRKTTVEDLAAEYAYVLTDLRNMGVLALALFAALIVVSFIL